MPLFRKPTLLSKRITFSRVLNTATGNVSYTGVGFKPTSLILLGTTGNFQSGAWGLADAGALTAEMCSATNASFVVNGNILEFTDGSTWSVSVSLVSYDADGFTLGYTLSGTGVGTATIYALCFR